MKKNIFVGCGFIDSQLLWIIPLVHGYCKKKKIKTIIFERKLSNKVLNNFYIKKILKNYEIIYLPQLSIILKYPVLKYFYALFVLLPLSLMNINSIKKEKMVKNSLFNWDNYQLKHAIWDQAIKIGKDGDIEPSLLNKIKASVGAYFAIFSAKIVLKQNCKDFFLGHSVYSHRAFLMKVRKKGQAVFCHLGFTVYRQYKNFDNSWCFLKKDKFIDICKGITKKKIDKYWSDRLSGKGNYVDSRIASIIKTKKTFKNLNYENVIFLHIFRDSPYADIDPSRIFVDYSQWIKHTLKTISLSDENWTLRLHPSYKRWGENQYLALNKIINQTFKKFPSNICLDDNLTSNNEVFKRAKRVVTFNGTSHLEAACYGIKSIIISDAMLSKLDNKLIFKPNSKSIYDKLLLGNSNVDIFKLNKNQINFAKKVMYIREKALKFETEVGGFHIFTRDSESKRKEDFNQTKNKLKNNINFLEQNGKLLVNDNDITLSKDFIQ
jgi:hypothetical protein